MLERAKQWSLGAVGVLIMVVGMSGAHAQAQTADGMSSFETHLRAGTEAQKNGEYRKAIEQFEKAAKVIDHPRLQLEIGQAYEELGECKNARLTYEKLGERSDLDAQSTEKIAERLSALESCVEYGELAVTCSVSGAMLEVSPEGGDSDSDQTNTGACPGEWKLAEGDYTLTARVAGLEDVQKQVRIDAGQKRDEFVKFEETMFVETPDSKDGFSNWGIYAGAGAAGVGAVLTTIALISDSSSGERLQELQKIEQSGNMKLFKERSETNDSIRTRNIGLYAGGAALILGGGGVLIWSLLSADTDDTHTDFSVSGPAPQKRGLSVQLAVQPREIGFRFQW